MPLPLASLDWIAFAWFVVWWVGYVNFAAWRAQRVPSLLSQMGRFRREWMLAVTTREVRIGDVSILGPVNTNDHGCEILRGWKSPKRSTA